MKPEGLLKLKNASQKPAILLSYGWPLIAFVANWMLMLTLCSALGEAYEISMWRYFGLALVASVVGTGIPTVWLKFNGNGDLSLLEIVALAFMGILVIGLQGVLFILVINAPTNEANGDELSFLMLNVTNIIGGVFVDIIMGLSGMAMINDILEGNDEVIAPKKVKLNTKPPASPPASPTPPVTPPTAPSTPTVSNP